jgi:hypothetical protein
MNMHVSYELLAKVLLLSFSYKLMMILGEPLWVSGKVKEKKEMILGSMSNPAKI